jgi:GNAT superfamily N-acetyltransferase
MDDRAVMARAVMARAVRAWAHDAAAFADALARLEPAWGSSVHEVAGGQLVISGRGLYVNRAIAMGVDDPATDDDIERVIAVSHDAGVTPAVEVTPVTHPDTVARLAAHGFHPDPAADVTALFRPPAPLPRAPDDVVIRPVRGSDDLALWQETSARGWGHVTEAARRASDAFTRAAHAVDGDGMVIAFDATDGRPLGCASTTIRDGLATLGGMSTVPGERGRGVQAAMVRHRLALAGRRGCDLAGSTAVVGGASERNLVRHGFVPAFTVATWSVASPA